MAIIGQGVKRKTGERGSLTLSSAEREQGTYVIGTTGTGKTTLLRNIAVEDMWNLPDEGLCVLDPHGDLTDELLAWVPPNRIQDVVYLNPMDIVRPFGLNLLDCDRSSEHEVRWVVSTIMETLHRLFWYSWGPRLEHVLQHVIRTSMRVPDSTFVELLLLLSNRAYRDEVVGYHKNRRKDGSIDTGRLDSQKDGLLISFWHDWFQRLTPHDQAEATASTLNKLSPFLLDSMMRNIIGQAESSLDIRSIMDEGKILFVNLSKGDIGEINSSLLGSMLVNLILIAALRRRGPDYATGRRRFHLIVDEYQNFANQSFAILQSEARKFGVDLIVAHQYRDQLDRDSQGASLNVGNFIVFRVSGRDSYMLASQFDNTPPPPDSRKEPIYAPVETQAGTLWQVYESDYSQRFFEEMELPRRSYNDVEAEMANSLSTLSNYEAYCRMVRKPRQGRPYLGEYKITTLEWPNVRTADGNQGRPNAAVRDECIKKSREQYGRDRDMVEQSIYERTGKRIEQTGPVPAGGIVRRDKRT